LQTTTLSGTAGPCRRSGDGAVEEVDLVLLAQDQVLHQVLERLAATLAAGRLDRFLQGLDRRFLVFGQPQEGVTGAGVEGELGDLRGRLAPEGDDLFGEAADVGELGVAERGQLRAERRSRSGSRRRSSTAGPIGIGAPAPC
jgi:hypothetical protein